MGGGPSKQYQVQRDVDSYNEKKRGKVLTISNLTGNDIVVAVFKVHSTSCFSGECPIDQTVRQSPRMFIAADDKTPKELFYRPLGFSERFSSGVKLYLYWSYPPSVKPGESKPSVVRLGFAIRSAMKRKPVNQTEIIGIANKYWPTVRDYYVDPPAGKSGFIANQIRPLVQDGINDVLLPNKLETVDFAVLQEVKKNRADYRNIRIAEPTGITKKVIFRQTTEIKIPPIKTTKAFYGEPKEQLALPDEIDQVRAENNQRNAGTHKLAGKHIKHIGAGAGTSKVGGSFAGYQRAIRPLSISPQGIRPGARSPRGIGPWAISPREIRPVAIQPEWRRESKPTHQILMPRMQKRETYAYTTSSGKRAYRHYPSKRRGGGSGGSVVANPSKRLGGAESIANTPMTRYPPRLVYGRTRYYVPYAPLTRYGGAGAGEDCTSSLSVCTTSGYTCLPNGAKRPDGVAQKTCQARAEGALCGARHLSRCPDPYQCSSYWSGTCQKPL